MNNLVITAAGHQLMSRLIAGTAKCTFTKVVSSDTDYTGADLELLTALQGIKQTVFPSDIFVKSDSTVNVGALFLNTDVTEAYYIRTLGIYAKDDHGTEVLYAVAVDPDPDHMPAYDETPLVSESYNMTIRVDRSEQVVLELNPAAIPTIEQVKALENKEGFLKIRTEAMSGYMSVEDKDKFDTTVYDDRDEYTFERDDKLRDGGIYVIAMNDEAWNHPPVDLMYKNMGKLCAIGDFGNGDAVTDDNMLDLPKITSDRGALKDIDERLMWVAEIMEPSTTSATENAKFKLRNLSTGNYLKRNSSGNITMDTYIGSDASTWTLFDRECNDYILQTGTSSCDQELGDNGYKKRIITTLTSLYNNTNNQFLRVSYGSRIFKLGNLDSSTSQDGRNGSIYLFRMIDKDSDGADEYVIDFSKKGAIKGNSTWTINSSGKLVITSDGSGKNTRFYLPPCEVLKRYNKVTIRYTKASGGGTFLVKYHQLGAGTRPQDDYKWGQGDPYHFPSNSHVRELTFDEGYIPVDEVTIFDLNSSGTLTVDSVTLSDPEYTYVREYVSEIRKTPKKAKTINIYVDHTEDTDIVVYVANVFETDGNGYKVPVWEDATKSALTGEPYTFKNAIATGSCSYGIAYRIVLCSDEHPVEVFGVGYKLGYLTAGTRGNTTNLTPGFGENVKSVSVEVDSEGNVIAVEEHTVRMPNSAATQTNSGLMSANDKKKLDSVKPTIVGAGATQIQTAGDTYTIYSPDTFSPSGSDAAKGLVPKPSTSPGSTKYLREDGSWATPPDTKYGEATTSAAGLMSASDKDKLDGVASGAEVNDHKVSQENFTGALPDPQIPSILPVLFSRLGFSAGNAEAAVDAVKYHHAEEILEAGNFKGSFNKYSSTPQIIGWLDNDTPIYRQLFNSTDTSGWDTSATIGTITGTIARCLIISGCIYKPADSHVPGSIEEQHPISQYLWIQGGDLKASSVPSYLADATCKYMIEVIFT